MNKKGFAVILVATCTIFNTLAQFFLKFASQTFSLDMSLFTNINFFAGGAMYGLSFIAYMYALKTWDLSTLSPLLSIQYVFVTLISAYFFHEPIYIFDILGLFFIFIGVIFIAKEVKT